MTKNFFLFFWALALFATLSKAQVSSVTGQYLQDNNLLLNPGFESGIGKWTNSAGTFTADYSVFVQGKASGKVVLSSQALNFFQDSTLFAAQLADGMQAILTVKIKSSVAGVRVCPRQAGSVITSLCIDVQGNNKWGLYQIPFVTGATSQGISINSNSTSITGTVYVDESYVGVSNILNSSSEAKLAGEAYFAGTTSCTWTRTSTTVGAFGTVAACPGPTISYQSLGQWQTTDSNLPRVTVNNLPAGVYKATFIVMASAADNAANVFAINDGTTTCEGLRVTNVAPAPGVVSCVFTYASSGNKSFEIYGASSTSTISLNSDSASPRASTKFQLEYYGSNSTYTTLNADTDWASCGHTTSSFTGFGTVSAIETQCKRQGSDLLMRGKFTVGTTTGTEARISLPVWNGLQTVAKSSVIPSIQNIGHWWGSNPLVVSGSVLINSNLSYITFASGNQGNNGFSGLNGSAMQSSTLPIGFESRIPIEGWQNSNIIIGQFNGLEKCTDSYECTDVFSAKATSAGVVSAENIDWINGNCTNPSTGNYTCTFKTGIFTVAPNCWIAEPGPSQSSVTSSLTTVSYELRNGAGVLVNGAAGVACQKQGVDYIGKTAKAVASDQNLVSTGVTKGAICSFGLGGASYRSSCNSSPCNVYNPYGCNPTITRSATGTYTVTFPANTWSGADYNCTYGITTYSTGTFPPGIYETINKTSTTLSIQAINASGASDSALSIMCHGTKP